MGSTNRKRAIVRYQGQVQGVGFRATAVRQASGADLAGWVRNEADGSVRLEVEGTQREIEAFLERIRSSLASRIEDEQVEWRESTGASGGFSVRH